MHPGCSAVTHAALGTSSLLHVLVQEHANKERERVGVEELVGVWIAGDGEISLHGAMIAREPICRSSPLASAPLRSIEVRVPRPRYDNEEVTAACQLRQSDI